MHLSQLACVVIIGFYLCASILIGELFGHRQRNSNQFLNATGSMPGWVTSISFLACNCGALEVIGLSGIASRYGVQAFHFYWIGAIPAMIFTGLVLLPIYVSSGVRSVPEYFGRRFGSAVQSLQAWILLASAVLFAGLCLYSLAEVMHIAVGWSLNAGAGIFACVVLAYVMRGGFRATVYNEIFQFVVMLIGLAPLLYFTRDRSPDAAALIGQRWHVWQATPLISGNSSVDLIGVVIGLGFVVSFSYWCTDFVLMQRALSARTLEAARRTPIIAGFGKLIFSMIVVFPVVSMSGRLSHGTPGTLDQTSPSLILLLYGPKLYSVGIAALVAGLVNGLASNVSAFSAVWTQEIYRISLRPKASEQHYLLVGRLSHLVCMLLSLAAAFGTLKFEGLSDFTLLIFSMSLVPFLGILVVGVLSRRGSTASAVWGVLAGIMAAGIFRIASMRMWIPVGSPLNTDFRGAILSFSVTVLVCITGRARPVGGSNETAAARFAMIPQISMPLWALSTALAIACLLLNIIWW